MQTSNKTKEDKGGDILAENEKLRQQLAEAQETLRAIQHGEVDALIVSTPEGEQVYSITGAEKPYRVLIEEMKEGAVMLSEDGRILYCNNGFAKIVKQPLHSLIGKSISGMVNLTHLNSFHELLASSRKSEGTKEKDVAFLATDGTVVPTHVSVNSSLKDNLKKTFLVITDLTQHMQQEVKQYTNDLELEITERKKAEEALRESEERLRFHAENTPLAVVEWDSKFVVTRWAGEAEKMFGWTAIETLGKPIMDLQMIYEPDIPIVEKTVKRLTNGETKVVSSNRNITKDGRVLYCTWYNSVLHDTEGKMDSVFSFVEDNTAKVKVEKELEEINKNLEKLVEERTKQLRDSERLAAIGATAGMVGHDIRNPLQAIISDVFLARNDLEKLSSCEAKESVLESLSEIEKNVDYINKIVADLQDYSKVLKPIAKETDLEALFNYVLFKNGIAKNIDANCIVGSQAKTIMSDPDLLKRILTNLVSNAVNAMPNGGKLTLHAFKQGGDILITVQDTGVGISEENKTKMFTPLFTTRAKGQGFGLPVVKRMTEALGGEVTFESQVGKGTTFTVRFPPPQRAKR